MGLKNWLSATAIVLLSASTHANASYACYDHPNPLNRNEIRPVPCAQTAKLTSDFSTKLLVTANAQSSGLQIVFNCDSSVSASNCANANKGFQLAKKFIEDVLLLEVPVILNATFTSFCSTLQQCNSAIIGQAGPKRTFRLVDTDNVERLYPQALVKQFQFTNDIPFDSYDITALFNADISWWYPYDSSTSITNSEDFVSTIAHEIVHGLGFMSAWNDYFGILVDGKAITSVQPYMEFAQASNGKKRFVGFFGMALDRLMYEYPLGKPNSDRIAAINQFQIADSTADWQTFYSAIIRSFESSSQYSLATAFLNLATNKVGTLALSPITADNDPLQNDGKFWLETRLKTWQSGSSVSHAAQVVYNASSDFLMCYSDYGRKTYIQRIADSGNITGNLIGPRLMNTFELLGYPTKRTPSPLYRPLQLSDAEQSLDSHGIVSAGRISFAAGALFTVFTLMVLADG